MYGAPYGLKGNHDASALPVDHVHEPRGWMRFGHPDCLGLGDAHHPHFRVTTGIGIVENDIPVVNQAAVFRGGVDPVLAEHPAVQDVPFPIDLEHPTIPDVRGFEWRDLLAITTLVARAAEKVDAGGIRLHTIQFIADVGEAVATGICVMADPLDLTVE